MARTETVLATGGLRAVHHRLEAYQKPDRGVSTYSRSVNRPAGRWLASLAAVAGLTPNQLTLLGAACSATAIGVIAFVPRTLAAGLAAGFLLMLAFALDSADGQLARLRHAESRRGEWLDHMLDAATKLGLPLAVLFAWYRSDGSGWWLGLPLAFLVVSTLLFISVTLGGLLRRLDGGAAETRPPLTGFGDTALRPLLQTPADHGATCVVFLLWGLPSAFAIGYTVVLIAQALFLVAFSVYWLKELS